MFPSSNSFHMIPNNLESCPSVAILMLATVAHSLFYWKTWFYPKENYVGWIYQGSSIRLTKTKVWRFVLTWALIECLLGECTKTLILRNFCVASQREYHSLAGGHIWDSAQWSIMHRDHHTALSHCLGKSRLVWDIGQWVVALECDPHNILSLIQVVTCSDHYMRDSSNPKWILKKPHQDHIYLYVYI